MARVTVSAFLDRYMTYVMTHTLRPKTQETYTIIIKTHLLPELGNIRLTALRPEHLEALTQKNVRLASREEWFSISTQSFTRL